MRRKPGADTENDKNYNILKLLKELTNRIGPHVRIDAVGRQAHGLKLDKVIDFAKQKTKLGTDRPSALREAIMACRKGGTVLIPGVDGGLLDGIAFGAKVRRPSKRGQTHMQRSLKPLMERIEAGGIDLRFLISHRMRLEEAPFACKAFKEHQNDVTKVMLTPSRPSAA